jgi:hypothetical protein
MRSRHQVVMTLRMTNTGDSDTESRSGGSNDTTARITFDFGISNIGKAHIAAM